MYTNNLLLRKIASWSWKQNHSECTFQFNKILIVWSYLVMMSLEYELTSKSKVILRCKDFYDYITDYDFNDEKWIFLLDIKLKTFPINDIRITLRTKRGKLDPKMLLSYLFLCWFLFFYICCEYIFDYCLYFTTTIES